MAVMPSDFWSGWIILLTVISFIGLGWLVLSVYFLPSSQNHDGEEPVWDNNLTEGTSSPPFWWFWLILFMMVFTVVYLMLYPGLGSFEGAFRWSQGGQLSEHTAEFEREYADIEADILATPYIELTANNEAMNSAASIFSEHCSACHGAEAMGQANLFPNLIDDDWQWGGTAEQIEQTLAGYVAKAQMAKGTLGQEFAEFRAKQGTLGTTDMQIIIKGRFPGRPTEIIPAGSGDYEPNRDGSDEGKFYIEEETKDVYEVVNGKKVKRF